ncbi:reverse transcriptase domain-containing protein [Trichonephila clavipes]|nr:reverse transcriptase domain-containing protein [Trichonephila clavipes]
MGRRLCLSAPFLKKETNLNVVMLLSLTLQCVEVILLNTAYKIFSNLLFARLQPYTDKVIGNYQCGFRPQRSTIDQNHKLRQILEKTKEYNIKTFHLFVDFKAAYDSINRDKMIEAMTEFKIPKTPVNLTKATLKNVRCRIKIQKYLSEPFTTERGLRQGDSLECLLFNLVLEKCIRDRVTWTEAAPCGICHYKYWLTQTTLT